MSLRLGERLAALDLEATCLRGPGCRVVSLALVPLRRGGVAVSEAVYAGEPPGKPVGETALIHGVTASSCPGAVSRVPLEEAIRAALGYTLVIYGRHDVELLLAEAERRGISVERICYKDLLTHLLRNPRRREEARRRGRYTLEDALEEILGLRPPRGRFHDPLSDAVHAGLLYLALARRGEAPETRCLARRRGLRGLIPRLLHRMAAPRGL